jgi:glyoxylase-like metal-dependent hydrolase (beta-lactamase superfamily II)
LKLGELEFQIVSDGSVRLDGGAMFGVIPKPMWEKKFPPDSRNRIQMGMNSLLIRTAGKTVLVETGAGEKWDARRSDMFGFDPPPRLVDRLALRGVRPKDIDIVLNTHLHFDHCGGNTHLEGDRAVPSYPNAVYMVQKGEFEHAQNPNERDRASYLSQNFMPVQESGQWQFLEGDQEIVPGVEVVRAPGHNADMQCVILRGGGKSALFFADLVPTSAHLPPAWIMGFDLYPMLTLENKKKWIGQVAREGWLALFVHDPAVPAAMLVEDEGVVHAEPVQVD